MTSKSLNLPSPDKLEKGTLKIGSQEFKIESKEYLSSGLKSNDVLKKLQKAVQDGVFLDLTDTDDDQASR